MKFFGYRSAADDIAPFEYRDFESGRGQIRGANQSVVTSADDYGVARRLSHSAFQAARRRFASRRSVRARAGSPE